MKATTGGGSKASEAYLRSQYDAVCKERDFLQVQVEKLEKDNLELKKSVFELSYLLSLQTAATGQIFRLDGHQRGNGSEAHDVHTSASLPGMVLDQEDERYLHPESELRGHTGAVYCASFSRSGRLLASGSLDKTIRIWETKYPYKQVACLSEHTQLVSDVAWDDIPSLPLQDEHLLYSSSFDHTVRVWDLTKTQLAGTTTLESFVLCVHPTSQCAALEGERGVLAGTVKGTLALIDPRTWDVVLSWSHSSAVQSVCAVDDVYIVTADAEGTLTWWDVRTGDAVASVLCDVNARRVCDVKLVRTENAAVYAANCSDHCMRLLTSPNTSSQLILTDPTQATGNFQQIGTPQIVHGLRGHVTGNWPIRCAFFTGARYKHRAHIRSHYPTPYLLGSGPTGPTLEVGSASAGGTVVIPGAVENHEQVLEQAVPLFMTPAPTAPDEPNEDLSAAASAPSVPMRGWARSLMLATASTDGRIYIYDLTNDKIEEARLWQVLEGHSDKVYSVCYHPHEPILASCSGDRAIRIWAPRQKQK